MRAVREAAPYLSMGTQLAITVALGAGLGYWADGHLGSKPWLLLLGAVAGVVVAMWQFYETVMRK